MDDDINSRSCGSCYACCVYLGIHDLNKMPGRVCKYLDGRDPNHRCRVYASDLKPTSCSIYYCAWRYGHFPPNFRPDESGLLITFYKPDNMGDDIPREAKPPGDDTPVLLDGSDLTVTITITDKAKAGSLTDGNLQAAIDVLIRSNFNDIRVVEYDSKGVIHFLNGTIRAGRLLKPDTPEDLKFYTTDPPVGRYEVRLAQPEPETKQ